MKPSMILSLLALILSCGVTNAEVPLLSSEELKSKATHIVMGKVRNVYSTTEKSENWEDTNFVAEMSVVSVEKGGGINSGDVIYAHYWKKKWVGKGDPEPHSSGHGGVKKGDFVTAYLKRKDGAYQVLLPNGFATLKPNEAKEVSPTASLQGTWNFAFYKEKGVVQEAGTKQFVFDGEKLLFCAGGQTRVETTIEVKDGTLDQKFKDGQVYRSIFARVGDLLIVCGNRDKERPTEFAGGTENGGEFLIVLEKQ